MIHHTIKAQPTPCSIRTASSGLVVNQMGNGYRALRAFALRRTHAPGSRSI